MGSLAQRDSNFFEPHESFIDFNLEINGPRSAEMQDDLKMLQESVQTRLKKQSRQKRMEVERDSCYESSPKADFNSGMNLNSQTTSQDLH